MTADKTALSFVEISSNRFGRRWAIKEGDKIIHMGYDFRIGKEIFDKLRKEKT